MKGAGKVKVQSYEDLQQAALRISLFGQELVISVYMMDGLLIDTGPAKGKEELVPIFHTWEMTGVILTHHHEDHTGLAHWVQENKDIPIYMHKSGIEICESEGKHPFYRQVFWGKRKSFQALPLEETFTTPNYTWNVIHTPGHAHDHIALFNREKKWMFGGDLYVHPKPKSMFVFESLPTTIDSLRRILTYDFEIYICSHAGIILKGRQAIERKLDYLVSIQEKILLLHHQGMSAKEIRKSLFPKRHPMNYLSFFENSPRHLVESVLMGEIDN